MSGICTVGRLIEKLQKFPSDFPIILIADCEVIDDAVKEHRLMDVITVNDVVVVGEKADAVAIKTTGIKLV